MPVIHPYVVARTGNGHGIDYVVQDYELGVLTGAKAMAMTVIDLLYNGAEHARRIADRVQSRRLRRSLTLSLMRSMLKESIHTE